MDSNLSYPLAWPAGWKRAQFRERGKFDGGTVAKCLAELVHEVNLVVLGQKARTHITTVVVSTNLPLRRDGWPSGSASEPADPGVAVYFRRGGKELCFACDQYDRVWKNMRALAKSLEAMRGIERWGSSGLLDRAMAGFAALPPPRRPDHWEILGLPSDTMSEDAVIAAWREKARKAHPDAGGSTEAFAELQQAKENALANIRGRAGR